ncbi:WD40-repeat-containing domain protein [Phakopsora pachyrhizi]|nr:WD40-repeat-containing domain protein [Phakopsora pachyrhizi]
MLMEYQSDGEEEGNESLTTSSEQQQQFNTVEQDDRQSSEEDDQDDQDEIETGGDVGNNIGSDLLTSDSTRPIDRSLISSTPTVFPSTDHQATSTSSIILRPTDSQMNVNVRYSDMILPTQGPKNPFSNRKLERMNILNGYVEEEFINEEDFDRQQRTFQVLKYAKNPSILSSTSTNQSLNFVGDVHSAYRNNGTLVSEVKIPKSVRRATKRKRESKGELGVFDQEDEEDEQEDEGEPDKEVANDNNEEEQRGGDDVDDDDEKKKRVKVKKPSREYKGPWAGWKDEKIEPVGPDEEEYEAARRLSTKHSSNQSNPSNSKNSEPNQQKRELGFGEEKSILHSKSLYDYQGRSYMHVPSTELDVDLLSSEPPKECFIPKRCVHTWMGHTKAVSAIKVLPGSGHLLLSASMDSRVKLWDIYQDGKCLRTFMGHSKAVRDINFSNDGGKRFLSAGYDRQIKLWDTETGHCVQAFCNGKIPYCVKFHPDLDKQNIFLAGMSDKKIIQYDLRSGEITQEYDQHLGPVNTITFVDENRRFVTTSDDKTIRAWDFDIPVVIKYIAEPAMHSMPAVTLHPNYKWLAMQSLDNQILIYSAESFKQNRKKRFAGHTTAGYACEVGFSPDGRYLSSGDGSGNMVFWDWKTCRIVKRIKCHNQVVISHVWLPHETSKVITASWDGLIKLWVR